MSSKKISEELWATFRYDTVEKRLVMDPSTIRYNQHGSRAAATEENRRASREWVENNKPKYIKKVTVTYEVQDEI